MGVRGSKTGRYILGAFAPGLVIALHICIDKIPLVLVILVHLKTLPRSYPPFRICRNRFTKLTRIMVHLKHACRIVSSSVIITTVRGK